MVLFLVLFETTIPDYLSGRLDHSNLNGLAKCNMHGVFVTRYIIIWKAANSKETSQAGHQLSLLKSLLAFQIVTSQRRLTGHNSFVVHFKLVHLTTSSLIYILLK